MTAQEIRQKYLEFFKAQDHVHVPRALLVPQNDPTTLFTGSGMQQMVPYLLGETHPEGTRLVDSQPSFRAEDMDGVGDNRHTTFFEMLGNWSLGDYFKSEQILWIWQFLIVEIGLDPSKLYVTCFIGDEKINVSKDTEAAEAWQELFNEKDIDVKEVEIGSEEDAYKNGMQDGRIFYYDAKKNWWSRAGTPATMPEGEPGGPCSEVFYEFSDVEHDKSFGEQCHPNCDCGRYMEIGNNVFMAYKKTKDGFEKLPKPNVDFGGGLERIAAAAIDSPDMFKISVLWPIIERLETLTAKKYDHHQPAMRVIADHVRAAVFLVTDGVLPSNNEQGYVARRLLRRAIRFAFDLGIEQDLLKQIVPVIVDMYEHDYPEVSQHQKEVVEVLDREEKLFRQTLTRGLREFEKLAKSGTLTGEQIFQLYDTYGFPVELTLEEMAQHAIPEQPEWKQQFDERMSAQRERSQTAGKGVFKGGLADHSQETTKLHTAHHLLLRALKDVLGDHVVQRGSNITAERLRIDFSHSQKVTPDELTKVEEMVNQKITENLPVIRSDIAREEAEKLNAEHEFGATYPDIVSLYSIGPKDASHDNPQFDKAYSIEFCGGPHVERTSSLGEGDKHFKIIKEEASSAGVRRIKAALQ